MDSCDCNYFGEIINITACVNSYEEALNNAATFINGLDESPTIQERLSFFKHWYYFPELDGFAPSKFIGYKNMDIQTYEVGSTEGPLDGRETEHALLKVFKKAEGDLKEKLYAKLEDFLGEYGKRPNKLTVIHIRKQA